MTILNLLLLWESAANDYDAANDYGDYKLVNSIDNYLYNLSLEIESWSL